MIAAVYGTLGCGRIGVDILPLTRSCEEGAESPEDVCGSCDDCQQPDAQAPGACDGGACPDAARDAALEAGDMDACEGDSCTLSCAPGIADCDGDRGNGCEADLNGVESCGGCDQRCSNAHGSTVCVGGRCVPTCAAGYTDCDADPRNGCEANTGGDPRHCGACGALCDALSQVCVAGSCQLSPCPTGRAECDADAALMCETDIQRSLDHCGFCGNACSVEHGAPACSAGSCAVASCLPDYADCDAQAANGCEANLTSSTAHCGGCNAPCTNANGTTRCSARQCLPSCGAGFADCDSSRANGCETPLDTIANCGACGRTCTADGGTPVCNAGSCATRCELSGTYALRMSVAGSWPTASYITGGNGTFQFWMRLQVTQSGTVLAGTLRECGRYIPPFAAPIVGETYLYAYPLSLFDGDFLPAFPASATLSSAFPGASFTLGPTAVQMGIDMALAPLSRDPVTAAWPGAASQVPAANRLDVDRDGRPGVTAEYADNYTHPRTGGTLFDPRSDNPYVASRVSFSLSGSLASCSRSTGSANVRYVDTRIYACSLESGECSASQADFLDRNSLNYTLGTASYTLVRVTDGASCSAIRAALP
ncbi:MAG TPA: hypothetical protein VFZ61_24860 [Polyangiales bacterium]